MTLNAICCFDFAKQNKHNNIKTLVVAYIPMDLMLATAAAAAFPSLLLPSSVVICLYLNCVIFHSVDFVHIVIVVDLFAFQMFRKRHAPNERVGKER